MSPTPRSGHLLVVTADTAYAEELTTQLDTVSDVRVTSVGTVTDALARLSNTDDIECVISDHDLPDVDAIAFLQAIRAQQPDLPFILFTSEGSEETASRAIHARVTDYLIKERYGNQWTYLATLIDRAVAYYRSYGDAADRPERARTILEASPDAMLIVQDGEIVFVNRTGLGLLDVDNRSDLVGEPPSGVLASGSGTLTTERLADIQAGRRTVEHIDTEIPVDDEDDISIEVTGTRILWNGEPAVILILHDVSTLVSLQRERDRLHREHVRERQFTDRIFEMDPAAKVILDPDGTIVRANERSAELFGMTEATLIGRAFTDSEWQVVDEQGEPIEPGALPFDRVIETGESVYGYEFALERSDAEMVWVSSSVGPIRNARGDIEYMGVTMEDVTEGKRLESELRASETLHRLVLSNITDTVLITDDEGQFTYICPNVSYLFGYTADEVREFERVEALLGDDLVDDPLEDNTVIENIEHEISDADGQPHHVLVTIKAVSVQGGSRLYAIRDVTDYKREQERFQTFVEHSSDIVTVVDTDRTIEYESPSIERVLGYDPDELVGENAFAIVHPDDRDRVATVFTEATTAPEQSRLDVEYRVRHADGTWRWMETVAVPRMTPGGGFVVNTRDITARKEAQAALQQRTTHLEQAQSLADLGSWFLDIQANELEWSEEIYRIFGLPEDDLTYEDFLGFVHPDDRAFVDEKWSAALEGDTYDIEHRIVVDGEVKWVHERAEIEFDDGDTPLRGIGVTQDITERKEREQRLQELTESRSLALEAANAGVWDWDLRTGELSWDESLERLYHLEPGTFEGTYEGFASRVHPADLPAVEEAVQDALARNGRFESEFRIVREDGVERWTHSEGRTILDDDGEPKDVIGVQIDITERKERELHLRVIDRVLRHNLRNDLNFIQGAAETIQDEITGEIAEFAGRIIDQSEKLIATADKEREIVELLTERPTADEVDLVELLENRVEAVQERYPEAEIELDLPSAVTVTASTRLGSAIEELIVNAIIHNDQADSRVWIQVVHAENVVQIRVADDGPTIADMNVDVLTGRGEEPLYHGSGLGLWLVHWIIRRSNGTLDFEENDPRGNVVTIQLQGSSRDIAGPERAEAG